jgi:2-polyprenyl-6-methoxyphenol hydroxylase-like FAD-dependent oxidoreductase
LPILDGMDRGSDVPRNGHAVVLGAGFAGLLTAQALARHFVRVTIVERDRVPAGGARPDIAPGEHLHVLLPGGVRAVELLLPGFAAELVDAGAIEVDAPSDVLWLSPSGWVDRYPARHRLLSGTRRLFERCVRRRVLADPGIVLLDGRGADGLLPGWDGARVSGVRLHDVDGDRVGRTTAVRADLVVDATGRRSRLPEWLDDLGFDVPRETHIDASLSSASRTYRRPSGARDWKAAFIQASPPAQGRMAVLCEVEGDRLLLTMQGGGGDHPPRDEAGFLDFARSLRSPVIYETVRDAEPLTPIVGFSDTSNRWRHYEGVRRWPDRLLAVGDAACALNPIYGQGISVAAQTAARLDAALARRGDRPLDGFAPAFRHEVAGAGRTAWTIATGDDLRYPTSEGVAPAGRLRLYRRYLDRLGMAATTDEAAMGALIDVMCLLARPESLFRPSVAWRALCHGSPRRRAVQPMVTGRRWVRSGHRHRGVHTTPAPCSGRRH